MLKTSSDCLKSCHNFLNCLFFIADKENNKGKDKPMRKGFVLRLPENVNSFCGDNFRLPENKCKPLVERGLHSKTHKFFPSSIKSKAACPVKLRDCQNFWVKFSIRSSIMGSKKDAAALLISHLGR